MDMTHIIVALIVTVAVLFVTWGWARAALGEQRPGPRWLLRPSNFLFVVGIAGVFYDCLPNPRIDPMSWRIFAGILILAFVLRHSENKAIY